MLGWFDIIAIVIVCITVILCFVVRASHGADVDALADDTAEIEPLKARLEALEGIVAHNARMLAPLVKDRTGDAVMHMSPGGAFKRGGKS